MPLPQADRDRLREQAARHNAKADARRAEWRKLHPQPETQAEAYQRRCDEAPTAWLNARM